MIKKYLQLLPFLLCVIFFTACDDEISIVQGLDKERDANEILVVLSTYQIKAKKEVIEKSQATTWTIKVSAEDEELARSVLVANNLPRVRLGGLQGICKDAGLILTPKTEKCRELLGQKEEIINFLESIACVVAADVVLNIPEKPDFKDENAPQLLPTATASVKYLKHCQSGNHLSEQRVQDIVANSVSGLDPRDVTVVFSYLDTGLPVKKPLSEDDSATNAKNDVAANASEADCPETVVQNSEGEDVALMSVAGLLMDEDSAGKFKIISLVFLVLFLLITAAFIFVLLRMSKIRKKGVAPTKALAPAKAKDIEEKK